MGTTLNQSDQLRLSGILAELARLKGEYRSFSSVGSQPNGVRKFRVTQQAHGFTAGQWVYWDMVHERWALPVVNTDPTDPTDDPLTATFEPLVLIRKVPTADTMDIVVQGYVKLSSTFPMAGLSTGVIDWTVYVLDSAIPGNVVTLASDQDINGTHGIDYNDSGFRRVACLAMQDGWVYLPGPMERMTHSHSIWDLYEVGAVDYTTFHSGGPATFTTGDFLGWTTDDTWGIVDGGNILIGKQTAPGVVGTINTTAAYVAMIKPTSANQVLGYDGTTIAWQTLGAASITNGSVTAIKLGADVFLESLKDVSITITPADSRVTNDFLTWNGTAWVNRNLGPIVCVPIPGSGAAVQSQMALDGGVAATVTSVVGVGHSGSRLYVGGGCSLDFEILNTPSTNNEYALRMLTSSAGVKFYDRARGAADGTSAGALAGTEVMEWGSDANGGSRYFKFMMNVQFQDTGTGTLTLTPVGTGAWKLTSSANGDVLKFDASAAPVVVSCYGNLDMTGNKIFMSGGSGQIAWNGSAVAISGSVSVTSTLTANVLTATNSIILSSPADIVWNSGGAVRGTAVSLSLSASASSIVISSTGIAVSLAAGTSFSAGPTQSINVTAAGAIGLYGATPVAQAAIFSAVGQTAGAAPVTYNQTNSQAIINDCATYVTAINAIRTALRSIGIVA